MFDLDFPEHSRPARLLEAHAARYFSWAASLPGPLADLARTRSTITGQPGDEPFTGPASINPLIACVPWLFWEVFSGLQDERFLQIAEAGACLTLASGVIDHLVDGQYPDPGLKTLLYASFSERGTSLFRDIFPPDSPFWAQFDRLTKRYIASLTAEVATQANLSRIDYDHFSWFSGGKVSPMVITIAGLAVATGRPQLLEPIERSLQKSYVAGQLLDDVLDWDKDFDNRHVTYTLTWFADRSGIAGDTWPDRSLLEETVQRTWIDIDALKKSVREFELSLEAVNTVECPRWRSYLDEYRGTARKFWDQKLIAHLHRIKLPAV